MNYIEASDTLTKYKTGFNSVNIRKWGTLQTDVLFGVITLIKDSGDGIIQFKGETLRNLMDFKGKSNVRWLDLIHETTKMMMDLKYVYLIEEDLFTVNLFEMCRYSTVTGDITLKTTNKGAEIFNNFAEGGFTVFDFLEYTTLKSGFSKVMFRHLKQWRTLGEKEYGREELFELLDLSSSMRELKNFNPKVLKVMERELSLVFENFKIEAGKKQGKKILTYKFTWTPETVSELLPSGERVLELPDVPEPDEPVKKKRGRPATKPETIARQKAAQLKADKINTEAEKLAEWEKQKKKTGQELTDEDKEKIKKMQEFQNQVLGKIK